MKDGYIVLQQHEWREWNLNKLNGDTLKKLLENTSIGSNKKLPNGKERDFRRRWAQLSSKTVKDNWSLANNDAYLCMDNIIHADIHWGKIAVLNVIADTNRTPEWVKKSDNTRADFENIRKEQNKIKQHINNLKQNAPTIKPMHYAVLWRLAGISTIQKVHGDGGPGNYHAVVPFTSDYEIIVHPGTHLLHASYKEAKNDEYYVTPNTAKYLKLQIGEMLLFHANIGHCGGRSSKKVKNRKEKRFKQNDINISWGGSDIKMDVTDLAMHYGIENCLFSKSIASDYLSNGIEQLRVREETPLTLDRQNNTVRNVYYTQKEMELKQKLKNSQMEFIKNSQGNRTENDYVFPEVFHMFNKTNQAMKEHREQLEVKFGDNFVREKGLQHHRRISERTTQRTNRLKF